MNAVPTVNKEAARRRWYPGQSGNGMFSRSWGVAYAHACLAPSPAGVECYGGAARRVVTGTSSAGS